MGDPDKELQIRDPSLDDIEILNGYEESLNEIENQSENRELEEPQIDNSSVKKITVDAAVIDDQRYSLNAHVQLLGNGNEVVARGIIAKLSGICHGEEIGVGREASIILEDIVIPNFALPRPNAFTSILEDVGCGGYVIYPLDRVRLIRSVNRKHSLSKQEEPIKVKGRTFEGGVKRFKGNNDLKEVEGMSEKRYHIY